MGRAPEPILWAVRWYLLFAVSVRDLDRMLARRDVPVGHVSLRRRVQRFAPEFERRLRPHPCPTGSTWHVSEPQVRVGGGWRYLQRAVDGTGRTVEFLLNATGDMAVAAQCSPPAADARSRHHGVGSPPAVAPSTSAVTSGCPDILAPASPRSRAMAFAA